MKSRLIMSAIAAMGVAAACSGPGSAIKLIPEENFNTVIDGENVSLYTLSNGGITMQVTNYGARVVTLWTPDRDGNYEDIVLGYKDIETYAHGSGERYLGAAVGTVANRIRDGRFSLEGKTYQCPKNNGNNTLHGGIKGVDKVVWDVVDVDSEHIQFHYCRPDGQDGFPGNLDIIMTYYLTAEGEFKVTYEATTDAVTAVNLSHHSFFNLHGEGKGTILDHEMTIYGDKIVEIDDALCPSGVLLDVEGTPFDFRQAHTIGERIEEDNYQLKAGNGYDHCWVLAGGQGSIHPAAKVYEPASGRMFTVYTDQPGIQFYAGNFFDGSYCGKYDLPLEFRASLALETQKFPDSVNHPEFPSTILRPGEVYTHVCVYKFEVK